MATKEKKGQQGTQRYQLMSGKCHFKIKYVITTLIRGQLQIMLLHDGSCEYFSVLAVEKTNAMHYRLSVVFHTQMYSRDIDTKYVQLMSQAFANIGPSLKQFAPAW